MALPGLLLQVGLKQLLGYSSQAACDWLDSRVHDSSREVFRAVFDANGRAWHVVGLLLDERGVWERLNDPRREADLRAARNELRELVALLPAEQRAGAARELRALHEQLAGGTEPAGADALRRFSDPAGVVADADRAAGDIADAEQLAGTPDLAVVLRFTPDGRTPLFQTLYRYYFRKVASRNAELSWVLAHDQFRALSATLDTRTAGILDQFDALFDRLDAGFAEVGAKLDAGFAGVGADLREIKERLAAPRKPGVSYDSEAEREYLRRAREQFRRNAGQVTAAQWEQLGDACSEARLYAEAGEAHHKAATAAHAARDTAAEAANYYKAYLDACEAGKWEPAFAAVWRAVDLDAARYAPFDRHRYKPERILGGGAFGTVFLCRDEYEDGRPLAVKSFRTDALDRDLAKVFAEARVLKALAHRNIIGVIDQGFGNTATRERPYLILEYCEGATLDTLVPLPVADFLPVARQVAEAVHAAHTRPQPIYHRDLKPSNIMVLRNADGTWAVKVIDFGLAVRAAVARAGVSVVPANRSTKDRSVTGTLKYAPPEQTGELPGVPVGPYSDVYAFGKTCLDVLFGHTQPDDDEWGELEEPYRSGLKKLLGQCVRPALAGKFPRLGGFEPVLKALADLDPAESAARERLAREAAERLAERMVAGEVAAKQRAEAEAKRAADERARAERVRLAAEAAERANREREAAAQKAREQAERQLAEQREREEAERQQAMRFAAEAAERANREREAAQKAREQAERQRRAEDEARRKAEEEAKAKDQLHPGRARSAGDKVTIKLPGNVRILFAWCPPGSFQMGETEQHNREPVRTVTLSKGFFMGVYPVTQAQWKAVMGTDPSHFKGPNRPVEQVSWDDAQEFCKKLKGKVTLRLPTEAEWEYACRAGTSTVYWSGNDEAALERAGWYCGNSGDQTQSVGQLAANKWGLHDFHGNVWEWCEDWYAPYRAEDRIDPCQSNNDYSDHRVLRGGSWYNSPDNCRAANRYNYAPVPRYSKHFGFRVCFHLG
jgi:formylglycine-generating enzyme required for sulfatase activity